ncbi:MAG: WxL domain-containing protein [Chloroflexi bacterium]|nr:WxL domain-containing protein [Chloroflexota bacterium]
MNSRTKQRNWLSLAWKTSAVAAAIVLLVVAFGSRADYTASAATFNVNVGQTNGGGGNADEFNPADITITEGDTVDFDWFNGVHDATSYAGGDGTPDWTSGVMVSAGTYSQAFATAGTYTYFCTIHASWADAAPGVIDANIAAGEMVGKITVNAAVVDTTGPATSSAAAAPNPTDGAASTTLTATVDDTGTGGSNIAAAEYFIDADPGEGNGTAMAAADASFNSATENVTASVDVSGLADGGYTLFVRGVDSEGNWGATDSVALTVSPPPAGAEDVSFTLTGGSLSLTTNPVAFGTLALSGVDQTVDTTPLDWITTDATGTGAGWNITVSSTDLTTTGGTITVDNLKLQLLDANIATVAGNGAPASQVTSYQPLSGAALKILSAAATTGMGTYTFPPDFRLNVPAESVPGVYAAFMTVSVNSGP